MFGIVGQYQSIKTKNCSTQRGMWEIKFPKKKDVKKIRLFPNSKTFESIFEPYYTVNKMRGWFVHNCSSVNDTKNNFPIIHQFMFHYGCFRFMKYCILLWMYLCAIIVQFRNQTKLCSNRVSIDPWWMRFSRLTFQQLRPKLRKCYSSTKTSRLLVIYCTNWLCFKIGAILD